MGWGGFLELVCDFDLSKKMQGLMGVTQIFMSHAEGAENTELAQASLCLGCHANLGDLWKVSSRGLAPRITGISRNVDIRHTRTFYFLNTNFSNCTNAFHKKILRDPCDTWRLVSGVSRVSRVMFILGTREHFIF